MEKGKMEIDNKYYIVELEEGVWLTGWTGDPGRTLDENNAKKFLTRYFATAAIENARAKYPERKFANAKVVECEEL